MLLSILLPTYNRLEQIRRQVEFLIMVENVDSNQDIEILASNNCSTDGTKDFLKSIADKYKCRIFNQEQNLGLAGNLVFLVNRAMGKYIWVIGDDDILHPGIVKSVLSRIKNPNEYSHIFLNHSWINNGNIIKKEVFSGKEQVYTREYPFFCEAAEQTGFGVLMFISANIYRRDIVLEANEILYINGEQYNLALPLAYSIYASKDKTTLISEVLLENDSTEISWKSQQTLVYAREMLAAYDVIVEAFANSQELRDFFVEHLPVPFPEYRYLIWGRRYAQDNYAMKFMFKYYPLHLVTDIGIMIKKCFEYLLKHIRRGA